MKNALLTTIIIAFCACTSLAQKFTIGGLHRGGTSPVNKQKMVERLKSELKLSNDEANAVVAIQQDYQLKSRAIKIDTQASGKEKKEKLQPIEEERNRKLKSIFTDEQMLKIDEVTREANNIRASK